MSTPPPPPPPPPGAGGYAPVAPMSPADQRLWSTLTHIAGIFFSLLPALIAYLVLKDRGAFVAEHTKTALNFQITVLIAYIVTGFIASIAWFLIIPLLLPGVVWVLVIVFSIVAAVKANAGELYQYPLTIRFIK